MYLAGRYDWAKLTDACARAFIVQIQNEMYAQVMNVGDQLPAQFAKTGALEASVKDQFDTLLEDVAIANDNVPVIIMGTKTALSKLTAISETDWISDAMKQERHTTGRLGIWEGVRLVEIPQSFAPNDTTTKLVDNTKLLIMPVVSDNKFIKIYDEGEAQVKEVSDGDTNMDKTIEYEYQQKMGVATIVNRRFGMYTMA